jgi:hypothetical protein
MMAPAVPFGLLLLLLCNLQQLMNATAVAASDAESWEQSEARRFRGLQLASGLLGSERDASKYNPTSGTLAAFPNATAGTFFSGVFSDHCVLQREPAKAAVYGVIFGASTGTTVEVSVASVAGSAGAGEVVTGSYSVKGSVMLTDKHPPGGRYARWKAYLQPAPAGGNYTITVSCASCKNTSKAKISDLTYGDVWFCSGRTYV